MSAFGTGGPSRPPGETSPLERAWGIGACERCGATLVLGDAIMLVKRETICSACAAAPAVPVTRNATSAPRVAAVLPPCDDRRLEDAA